MLPMYIRRRIHDLQEKRRIVRKSRSRIGQVVGNVSVIEIGCGFGSNSRYCKGPYLGIDIDRDAIQEAKKRYPMTEFLCKDLQRLNDISHEYDTVLFCAVLHEMPNHADALKTCGNAGIHRIVVCDYDPELRGWLRLWMDVFEPEAMAWWNVQPRSLLPESEWSLRSGRISRSLLWWEFNRTLQ